MGCLITATYSSLHVLQYSPAISGCHCAPSSPAQQITFAGAFGTVRRAANAAHLRQMCSAQSSTAGHGGAHSPVAQRVQTPCTGSDGSCCKGVGMCTCATETFCLSPYCGTASWPVIYSESAAAAAPCSCCRAMQSCQQHPPVCKIMQSTESPSSMSTCTCYTRQAVTHSTAQQGPARSLMG